MERITKISIKCVTSQKYSNLLSSQFLQIADLVIKKQRNSLCSNRQLQLATNQSHPPHCIQNTSKVLLNPRINCSSILINIIHFPVPQDDNNSLQLYNPVIVANKVVVGILYNWLLKSICRKKTLAKISSLKRHNNTVFIHSYTLNQPPPPPPVHNMSD